MLSYGFIRFVLLFLAIYGALIALIYCAIQGFYLVKTMNDVMPLLERIDDDLDKINIKSDIIATSFTTNINDLKTTLHRIGNILFFIRPWLRHLRYGKRLEKMENKIDRLLRSIDG